MGGSQATRGGGFVKGALAGLLVSALALAAWSLSTLGPERRAAPEAMPDGAPPPAATDTPAAPEPAPTEAAAAPEPSPNETVATPEPAPAEAAATPQPAPIEAPATPEPATAETTATPQPAPAEPPATSDSAPAEATPSKSETPAPASVASGAQSAADNAAAAPAPVEPAWRRNAAAFDARGKAAVAVVIGGLDGGSAARALSLGAPVTLALDPAAPGSGALAAQARAAGAEVLSLGAEADPRAVGLAAETFDAAALDRAGEAGLLALTLTPGARPAASGAPVAAAAFRLDGAASAERVFQTLQEAVRRAGDEGGQVVALEASQAALTGLARWLAVTDAAPAPLSAVAR